jgi:hypothetical protein
MDGKTDGFDPECSGPYDDREDSFATGIPGDNMDATMQECFFDGDSGAGNDGCNQHVCCLLQAGGATMNTNDDQAECARLAPNADSSKYERAKCYKPFGSTDVPDKCKMNCGPLAPPGCDCFGCCTVCQDPSDPTSCRDVALNPQVSPNCDQTNITNPGPDGNDAYNPTTMHYDGTGDEPCKRCYKADCGTPECGGETCVLCPGQDPNTPLPPSCGGTSTCPQGIMPCAMDGSCPTGTYCQTGCCVGVIQ